MRRHLRNRAFPHPPRKPSIPPSRSRSARPAFRSPPNTKNHPKLSSIHSSDPIRELHSAAASDQMGQNVEQCLSHTRQAHPAPATCTS